MSNTVNLTTNMSSALYALKVTSKTMEETNNRLATGLKVSSALDDPIAYFASEDHTDKANGLSSLNDSMNEAIQTINSASDAVEAIKDLLDDAKALCNSALSTDVTSEKEAYLEQFNDILSDIDSVAEDAGYGGVNLLQNESLTVVFNEDGTSSINVAGFTAGFNATSGNSVSGLTSGLVQQNENSSTADTSAWTSDDTINNLISAISDAKSELRSQSKTLSSQLSVITTRQEFTEKQINVLETGAADLVNADLNEESANLLALQTQQQLGTNALSIASQSMQSVLNLF